MCITLHHGFQSQPLRGAMPRIWRIHKLLNLPLLHPQGAFGMINIFFRNAHYHLQIFKFYNPIAASPIGHGRAATPHRNPKVVPHIFQLPALITQPPTHEIPSAPEPSSANLSPSTACANSVVERRGRNFHPCSRDVPICIRVYQGGRHAIVLRITLSINLPMTSHALGIIHSASEASGRSVLLWVLNINSCARMHQLAFVC